MITVYGTRDEGRGEFHGVVLPKAEWTEGQALKKLVDFELKWGGRIKDVTSTTLKIETRVLNCLDTTYFEGSEDEMAGLVLIAIEYEKVLSEERAEILAKSWEALRERTQTDSKSVLLITTLANPTQGEIAVGRAIHRLLDKLNH
jgi:hypothetical protein